MGARPEDAIFARHVLERRYATGAQVQECLKLLERLRGEMELDETLGHVLLKKGYLSQAQFRELERVLDPTPSADRKNAIPGYRLLERIGVGAMGAVYKAHHLKLDIPVAIKVLRTSLSSSPTQVERLKREARLVARLTHPNIVVSRDVGEADGVHYLAMEYVDGSTVRALLRGKRLPEKYALQITREVARALEHAHERGVIHRDVKPGNIMVTKDGRVKLADFGLARSKTPSDLTLEHASIGTPQYVAPEQMRRAGDARPRSDLFSLGATLYHMVTGQPPFDGENLGEIVQNVLACRFPPPETIRRDLSVDTLYVIHRLMRCDPRERYASATELIADIERIERGERVAPATFRGDQLAYLRRKRRRAAGVAVAVAVAVAAVAFVAAHWIRSNRREAERAQACRALDARGAGELAAATTVGRLRDLARELRAELDGAQACRAGEVANLAQRVARAEADMARIDEADGALRKAGEPDANFRTLHADVIRLRGAMHFQAAQEHVEKVAQDVLTRSRAAAQARFNDVYYTEYGHMGEARDALAALAKELRERFATTDHVEATARDASAYAALVEAWKSAHDEWKGPYDEARRSHRYAEAWAKYESFRAGCARALDLVHGTDLSPQLLAFFEVVDDEAALAGEERRYFAETVRRDAEQALAAADAERAQKIVADFVRVAKATRKEAEELLETIRGRTNVTLLAQRKALTLLEERVREGLRERRYGWVADQVAEQAAKAGWLPEIRAALDVWSARARNLVEIRGRFEGEDWATRETAALMKALDFSDGRLGDPKLRGHFRWAESYRADDPRAAAELLRLALLDLDQVAWADALRERRQRILDGLPAREEEAKRLLEQMRETEARKDYVLALAHCRLLLDRGRNGLRYTDTVDAIAKELGRKRDELNRLVGAAEWRVQAGLPNDPAHFSVDPESNVVTAVFDFRPWWPDEGKAPAGVDEERWLEERGKAYWYEQFRAWPVEEPEEEWPKLLERVRRQLRKYSDTLEPAPEGGAVLKQDYAAWWPGGEQSLRSFELSHPFRVDEPWSVELVVRWEDPDGAHGGPGYFALAAGRVQAGVVYTSHEASCGGRGALLFESEAMVPDDLEKRFAPFRFRTYDSDRRPKLRTTAAAYGNRFDLRPGRDHRIRLSHEGSGVIRFAMGAGQGKMKDIVWREYRNLDQRLLLPGDKRVFRFVSQTTCRILRVEIRGKSGSGQ